MMPTGITRTAKHVGSQCCVTLPIGKSDVSFTPVSVKSALPDPKKQPWPMGDLLPKDPMPPGIEAAKVQQSVEAAFDPAAMTAAFVVTWKGRIIAERYGENVTLTRRSRAGQWGRA
jgi:hypothetical protein